MDPLHIALRALFAYVFLLVLARLSGKRLVRQSSAIDFTIALVVGDMVDDLLWAEVVMSEFVVAVGVLFLTHLMLDTVRGQRSPY